MPSGWQDRNQDTQDVLIRFENRVYKVFSLIGVVLAVVMSWQYNHSVLWADFAWMFWLDICFLCVDF